MIVSEVTELTDGSSGTGTAFSWVPVVSNEVVVSVYGTEDLYDGG